MKIATAGVLLRNKKILIAKRNKDGLWEFPGGRVDPGETSEECVIREYKEEMNIDVQIMDQLPTVQGFFRYTDMKIFVYVLGLIKGKIELDVHSKFLWIKKKALRDFEFVDEDQEIIAPLEEYLKVKKSGL